MDKTSIKVDGKQTPIRIDIFLINRMEHVTRNRIQNAIKEGLILVNEGKVKPNYKIRPHDIIEWTVPKKTRTENVIAEDIPLEIVFEDEDLMVINKPAGMIVHPGISNPSGTLVNGIKYHLSNQILPILEGNPNDRPGIVHRIDKNTTGLLVVAKNSNTLSSLASQFYNHTVKRQYLSLVWGSFQDDEGTIVGNIDRDPKNRKKRKVIEDINKGKHAVTHYKVLEDMYYVSLIQCELETGRTHQIRVHMSYKHHPVFNDDTYGGDQIMKGTVFTKYKQFVQNCFKLIPRHALHAQSLGFIHPSSGQEMMFNIDPPKDFLEVVEKWRKYVYHKRNKD